MFFFLFNYHRGLKRQSRNGVATLTEANSTDNCTGILIRLEALEDPEESANSPKLGALWKCVCCIFSQHPLGTSRSVLWARTWVHTSCGSDSREAPKITHQWEEIRSRSWANKTSKMSKQFEASKCKCPSQLAQSLRNIKKKSFS